MSSLHSSWHESRINEFLLLFMPPEIESMWLPTGVFVWSNWQTRRWVPRMPAGRWMMTGEEQKLISSNTNEMVMKPYKKFFFFSFRQFRVASLGCVPILCRFWDATLGLASGKSNFVHNWNWSKHPNLYVWIRKMNCTSDLFGGSEEERLKAYVCLALLTPLALWVFLQTQLGHQRRDFTANTSCGWLKS